VYNKERKVAPTCRLQKKSLQASKGLHNAVSNSSLIMVNADSGSMKNDRNALQRCLAMSRLIGRLLQDTLAEICAIPRQIWFFVKRICDKFGYRFTFLCFCVYGISQGRGNLTRSYACARSCACPCYTSLATAFVILCILFIFTFVFVHRIARPGRRVVLPSSKLLLSRCPKSRPRCSAVILRGCPRSVDYQGL
jgi:hypothetical protein